jgi:hypothetical protein
MRYGGRIATELLESGRSLPAFYFLLIICLCPFSSLSGYRHMHLFFFGPYSIGRLVPLFYFCVALCRTLCSFSMLVFMMTAILGHALLGEAHNCCLRLYTRKCGNGQWLPLNITKETSCVPINDTFISPHNNDSSLRYTSRSIDRSLFSW